MAWLLLLIGLALWAGAHFFKRVAPEARVALGEERGKGIVAITLLASVVLIVIGYRATPFVPLWEPPSFFTHINNLLMLAAFYLMSPAPKKGRLLNTLRHPMLLGFSLWAVAHLLVNGDLTAVLTFGGLLAWALASMRLINAAEPEWTAPSPGAWKWDGMGLGGAVGLLVVIGLVHGWIGPWPFGG